MVDAFVGKFEVESRENFEGFLKGIGIPEEHIEAAKNAKVQTEITKDGDDITVVRTRPMRTSTNTFKLGEQGEIDNLKGEKVKVTVNLVDGKLVAKGDEYSVTSEIVDGKLKETITLKGHTMSRVSVKK